MNTDREEERARCIAVCKVQVEMLDKVGDHERADGARIFAAFDAEGAVDRG